jgi:hypothetical protein
LGAYGVTQGQGPANGNAVGGSTNSVSKRSARICKPTAKLEALTISGVLASRTKRNVVLTDDEEEVGPRKKTKVPLLAEDDPDIDSEETGLDERPKRMTTRVFSQASEDAQVTRANTEASFNLEDSENEFTGAGNTTEAGGSDEEEWNYSQLDEMAAKDARVSNNF